MNCGVVSKKLVALCKKFCTFFEKSFALGDCFSFHAAGTCGFSLGPLRFGAAHPLKRRAHAVVLHAQRIQFVLRSQNPFIRFSPVVRPHNRGLQFCVLQLLNAVLMCDQKAREKRPDNDCRLHPIAHGGTSESIGAEGVSTGSSLISSTSVFGSGSAK